jgi:hypothetical protein
MGNLIRPELYPQLARKFLKNPKPLSRIMCPLARGSRNGAEA